MKILIVTAWYAPFIHPRAHRWTALAEHWAKEGHTVHVLTARLREQGDTTMRHGVRVHRIGFDSLKEWAYHRFGSLPARGRVGLKPVQVGLFSRGLQWVYQNVWKGLYFPDDACVWYFPARKKMRQLLENEQFDAVITVSLPFTGHLLGYYFSQRNFLQFGRSDKAPPVWLADIGDPFSFQANPPNNTSLYGKYNRRLERRILESAQVVTVTTAATRSKYRAEFGAAAVANLNVVPPLFQPPEPWKDLPNLPPHTSISLAYFGALYRPTRTPDAFLDLLERTFVHRPDLRKRVEIHFYGEVFPEFFTKLEAAPNVQLHGLCDRKTAWKAMWQTDILLNIGNTTDFQLPSKAVDYLAAGRPILHLSYVENDPFVAFFEGNPLLFTLKVEQGTVSDKELERWIVWLEGVKPMLSRSELESRVAPYLLPQIAAQYLGLIAAAPPE
jgi:hypothetical protein